MCACETKKNIIRVPINEAIELGVLLGKQQAFGMVAGRCTAAQVDAMRRIRDNKLYLSSAATWAEYSLNVMKMTHRNANLLIGHLNEFGPGFFDLAQMTGITPAAYRKIAPAVQSDGIHLEGTVIALIPENSEKAADAVTRLLAGAEPQEPARRGVAAQRAALDGRGRQFAKACAKLAASDLSAEDRQALLKTVQDARVELLRVELRLL